MKNPSLMIIESICERPVRKKDSVTHSMYDTPVAQNKESDDEEMLPMGRSGPYRRRIGQW